MQRPNEQFSDDNEEGDGLPASNRVDFESWACGSREPTFSHSLIERHFFAQSVWLFYSGGALAFFIRSASFAILALILITASSSFSAFVESSGLTTLLFWNIGL